MVPFEASLILAARPKELSESAAARAVWRAVVLEEREQAFVGRTGVDPLQVTELVAFEVPPNGYVLLARGPFVAEDVVKRMGQRVAVLEVTSDAPFVRREGLRGDGRYAYISLDRHTVLSAKDTPPALLAKMLGRYASAAVEASETKLTALAQEHESASLLILHMEPLAFEVGTPIALLFAQQKALALAVRPHESSVSFVLNLYGEFPHGAAQNFRTLLQNLARTPLGNTLGLSQVAESTEIRVDERGTSMAATLDPSVIEAALNLLVASEMKDLLL